MGTNWTLGEDGKVNVEAMPPYDDSKVQPDPTNKDSTDWPRRGCRNCGRRDRPQYGGVCNDDSCSHE